MEALSTLSSNSPAACQELLSVEPCVLQQLLALARQPQVPRLRLLGAACATALSQAAPEHHLLQEVSLGMLLLHSERQVCCSVMKNLGPII
jgi:hypothetical protein